MRESMVGAHPLCSTPGAASVGAGQTRYLFGERTLFTVRVLADEAAHGQFDLYSPAA